MLLILNHSDTLKQRLTVTEAWHNIMSLVRLSARLHVTSSKAHNKQRYWFTLTVNVKIKKNMVL